MERIKAFYARYRRAIAYVFFGGLATLVNIGSLAVLDSATRMPAELANALAILLSILFAYVTNRIFVFHSTTKGKAALREFISFLTCRTGTGIVDELLFVLGVSVLDLWPLGVKLFASVFVIVGNYVFSKLWIFRQKSEEKKNR